jgi:hypothetical protein
MLFQRAGELQRRLFENETDAGVSKTLRRNIQ